MITRAELEDAFAELGDLAAASGVLLELAFAAGGSCLLQGSAVAPPGATINETYVIQQTWALTAIGEISRRRGWPGDWLTEAGRRYLGDPTRPWLTERLTRDYSLAGEAGLRVLAAPEPYIEAMRLFAMRAPATVRHRPSAGGRSIAAALLSVAGSGSWSTLAEAVAKAPTTALGPALVTFPLLVGRDPDLMLAAIAPAPALTGDHDVDAFIGAVAEHVARAAGLPAPRWTHDPRRFLEHPWFVSEDPALAAHSLVHSPSAFRRRLVLAPATPWCQPGAPLAAAAGG